MQRIHFLRQALLCLIVGVHTLTVNAKSSANFDDNVKNPLIYYNQQRLDYAKSRVDKNDKYFKDAYNKLIREADNELRRRVDPVTNGKTPPSGNKNDYYSIAAYAWPNPNTRNGMPWKLKDGQYNRAASGSDYDKSRLNNMLDALDKLSLAFHYTKNDKYVGKMKEHLDTWFINSKTRVNPHLKYSQGVPGEADGKWYGIIDWAGAHKIVTAMQILENHGKVNSSFSRSVRSWLDDYADWLLKHPFGVKSKNAGNNHSNWYNYQLVGILRYLNRNNEARALVTEVTKKKINTQLASDGSQPAELGRTKSLHYSSMNLKAFCFVAELGMPLGVDLWNYKTKDGKSLKKAAEFLVPYVEKRKNWKWKEIKGVNNIIEGDTKPALSIIESLFNVKLVNSKFKIHETLDYIEKLKYPPYLNGQVPITQPIVVKDPIAIPGTVQAEKYSDSKDGRTETTSDVGGGLNVGWIDEGDWLEYTLNVKSKGTYTVQYRVASQSNTVKFSVKVNNNKANTVETTASGGWQTWKTVSKKINLDKGVQKFRIQALNGGWNFNWIKFDQIAEPNKAPIISFKNNKQNIIVNNGYDLSLEVLASDTDGDIANVELFINNKLVRRESNAPYEWGHTGSPNPKELEGLKAGTYTIKAIATDDDGAKATASFVLKVDSPNRAPVISFKNNKQNVTLNDGYDLSLEVLASDTDGKITNVDLFINNRLVRKEFNAPYEWGHAGSPNPKELEGLKAGTYNIRAVATDNEGANAATNFTLIVKPAINSNKAPKVAFIKGNTNDNVIEGYSLNVEVDATDPDGTIEKVALYLDNKLIREEFNAPYEWGHEGSPNSDELNGLTEGSYTIKAIAIDNEGLESVTSFELNVKNNKPTSQVLLPIHDAFIQGSTKYNNIELRTEQGRRTSYLMFDLSAMGGVVTNSELRLTVGNDVGNGQIKIYLGSHNTWTENNLSNANKPKKGELLATKNTSYRQGATYIWNLKSLPVGKKVSLIVEHGSGNDVSFWSKEGAKKPELSVTTRNVGKTNFVADIFPQNEDEIGKVYPIPAQDAVFVRDLPKPISKVEVYSLNGAMVISQNFSNTPKSIFNSTNEININSLNSGRFIMKIYFNDQTVIQKHVVKR